jgi:hypothetical protein
MKGRAMEEERTEVGAAAPAESVPPAATDAVVEAWFSEWFFNVGLPTELHNRLRSAADNLKTRLAGRE